METFSALLAICAGNSPVPGEFPSQRPVTRSFHISFDLRMNKRLGKQSWGWWFETPSRPLWRQCNVLLPIAVLVVVRYCSSHNYTTYTYVIAIFLPGRWHSHGRCTQELLVYRPFRKIGKLPQNNIRWAFTWDFYWSINWFSAAKISFKTELTLYQFWTSLVTPEVARAWCQLYVTDGSGGCHNDNTGCRQ